MPLCIGLPSVLADRIATHFDTVGVVNQSVEDTVG
jgi:hypothetical protein